MSYRDVTEEIIVSYVDGELLESEEFELKSLLLEYPDLNLRVEIQKKVSLDLKSIFTGSLEATPNHIIKKIDKLVDDREIKNIAEPNDEKVISFADYKSKNSWVNMSSISKIAAGLVLGILTTSIFDLPFDLSSTSSINEKTEKPFTAVNQESENLIEVSETALRAMQQVKIKTRGKEIEKYVGSTKSLADISVCNLVKSDGFLVSTEYRSNGLLPCKEGPVLIKGVPFKLSFTAPITGQLDVYEVINGTKSNVLKDLSVQYGEKIELPEVTVSTRKDYNLEFFFRGLKAQYKILIEYDVIDNVGE